MEGWISLHRKMLEWEWYQDPKTKVVFIHCLIKANNKPRRWRGIELERGEFWTSVNSLSKELNLSIKEIRTALKKLKSTGELTLEGNIRGTKVTVCKYDKYQLKNRKIGQESNIQTNTLDI